MPRHNTTARSAAVVTIDGQDFISFGGCDYLGLAHHPAVLEAVVRGLHTYGLSASASRETTGNTAAHDRLEARLAEFTGLPAALVVPEGYLANMALCQAIARDIPIALLDERSHRSMADAAIAAGMQVHTYRHRDAAHAAELAKAFSPRRVAILTDGIFTADGSVAPLPELLEATPADGVLVVDDCHGLCIMGPRGRSTLEHFGLRDPRLILTTTLAKGLGCYGGAVLGPRRLIDSARTASSAYRCTTPVPPAIAVAARAALDAHACELWRVKRLRENAGLLRARLLDLGLCDEGHHPHVPIFAFTLDSDDRMSDLAERLSAQGFLVPLIEYPGGPAPRYFRISVTALHDTSEIERLASCMGAVLAVA